MKILITNRVLNGRTGTEIVVRDLSLGLRRLGHEPQVYCPAPGPIADEIRSYGVPVASHIRQLETTPDVIHGHHHPQILQALLRFPKTPAVMVCHDATTWLDEPLMFPRIIRYVAVDDRCRRRFDGNPGILKEKVSVIFNAVDLARFKARPPLPHQPRRAAIFSNNATRRTHVRAVMKACRSLGLRLDVIGSGFGTAVSRPEEVLPQYDLVFAKARCGLEAMAVGAAVVLCDAVGLGSMVNPGNFSELRRLNFGAGTLTRPLDPELVAAEIQKYDAQDAGSVSQRVRAEANLSSSIMEWIELYGAVRSEYAEGDETYTQELAALADYLERWGFEAGLAWENARLRRSFRWIAPGGRIDRSLSRGLLRRLVRNG